MAAETFVLVVLVVAALTLLANVLLWIPVFGKIFYLIGKILRFVGFIVGLLCLWAIFALLEIAPSPI